MPAYRSLRDFDWLMLILVCAICALGVLQIFSATHDTHYADAWWKQAIWIMAGFMAMWIATLIDYHTLLGQVPILYVLSVATSDRDLCRRNDAPSAPAAGSAPPAIIFRCRNSLNW